MLQPRIAHQIAAIVTSLGIIGISTPSGAANDGDVNSIASSLQQRSPEVIDEARAELITAATAYNVALLVEADLANTEENVDDVLIARLVDEELPVGRENAAKWVSSLDESAIRSAGVVRADKCLEPKHGCSDPQICVFGDKRSVCTVTSCGDGACKACWDVFGDLRKLAVKGWCAYTCQQGAPIVGIKLVLHVRILGELSACLPLSTPVP